MTHYDLIVIGSGQAGISLVKKVKALTPCMTILVITESSGDFYYKPDLSTAFSENKLPSDLIVDSCSEWSSSIGVDVIENTSVKAINSVQKKIELKNSKFCYEKLVFATGAEPKVVSPFDVNGERCYCWNHLADYKKFYKNQQQSDPILIVGAGMIGVELACDLASAGKAVFVFGRNLALDNLVPAELSEYFTNQLAKAGITFITQNHATIEYSNGKTTLEFKNDQSKLSFHDVVLATGLTPRTDLAESIGCEIRHGIVCNHYLESSVKDIYAIGDCAEIFNHVDMYIEAIECDTDALAKTLSGYRTITQRGRPTIFLKSPNCPTVIQPPYEKIEQWVVTRNENGASALAMSENDDVTGFVLMGGHCRLLAKYKRKLKSINSNLVS